MTNFLSEIIVLINNATRKECFLIVPSCKKILEGLIVNYNCDVVR